jgi:ribonuclease HI
MPTSRAQYLLFTEASIQNDGSGQWRFMLEQIGSSERFAASDVESWRRLERLELLAVVRGLEALDAPARVTLVTRSRYVSRGLRCGLDEWRSNDWHWERFGEWTLVRDADLWQRVDVTLQYHLLQCRLWQFDAGHQRLAERHSQGHGAASDFRGLAAGGRAGFRRAVRTAAGRAPCLSGMGLAAG